MENNVPTFDFEKDDNIIDKQQEDKKKANILCWISLGLNIIVPLFCMGIMENLNKVLDIHSSFYSSMSSAFSSLAGASLFASFVLMIIARVKYKKSKFALVLMIIYIIEIIIAIALVVVLIIACASCVSMCKGLG